MLVRWRAGSLGFVGSIAGHGMERRGTESRVSTITASKHAGAIGIAKRVDTPAPSAERGLTRLAPFSGSTFRVRIASTIACADSTRFLFTTGLHGCNSSTANPFWCRIFICFTIVDLPLSPLPRSRIYNPITGTETSVLEWNGSDDRRRFELGIMDGWVDGMGWEVERGGSCRQPNE